MLANQIRLLQNFALLLHIFALLLQIFALLLQIFALLSLLFGINCTEIDQSHSSIISIYNMVYKRPKKSRENSVSVNFTHYSQVKHKSSDQQQWE